ncbi:MAG: YtxH domain-containing protein [Nitrospiraceae bacterium]|nr:YtxH domain-containing protein [Nitrospiraceae bacterium]
MSERGKQVAKVAALIAGGAIIGAGIGLLFAPKTGAETRRDVSRYARKAQVQATRWSRAMQSGMKDALDRSREVVKHESKPELEAVLN